MFLAACFHRPLKPLVLDDFEDSCGPACIDYGAGNGSKVKVSFSSQVFYSGKKSLKIEYQGTPSGYIYVARGYGLTNKKAASWLVKPQKIAWKRYEGFSFYLYGEGKGIMIAFDIKDKNNEMFRCLLKDNKKGWQKVVCPFNKFFSRTDWQPDNAVADGKIDFPVMSFQFEPRTSKSGLIYIDKVELLPAKKE